MKNFIALLSFAISLSALATQPGFEIGNQIEQIPLQGFLTVRCHSTNETQTRYYHCRNHHIQPASQSYFKGPKNIVADSVRLTAVWENGNTVTKTHRYNAKAERTSFPVNLVIATLLQKPLLSSGTNNVTFEMFNDSEPVAEGFFTIDLQTGAPRNCPQGFTYSSNMNDCQFSDSVCRDYFINHNYCQ